VGSDCQSRVKDHKDIEVIVVLGSPPTGMTAEKFQSHLNIEGTRWVTYDQLIAEAQAAYREYLEANKKVSRILELFAKV